MRALSYIVVALAANAHGCGRIAFDPLTSDAPRLAVDAPRLMLDSGQCPPMYGLFSGSCYRVAAANGWLDGELACEADAVGAHLVVIDNDSERTMLIAGLQLGARTWIGTSKRQSASYLTVTGMTPYLDLGVQTEPSEDCLSIHDDGLMYLHSCTDSNPYVCEYDGVPADPSAY